MKDLPKIDLHLHLDGAVRTTTIIDLAREQDKLLPSLDPARLNRYVRVSPSCSSLSEFLSTFEVFSDLLKSPEAIERITREAWEDLAKDNVIYAEVRFAPVLNISELSDSRPRIKAVIEAAVRGLKAGKKKTGVEGALILCCYRGFDPEYARQTVELALEVNQENERRNEAPPICGIDLAGDESRYGCREFKEAFALASENGLPATVHAGEAAGAESIRDALEILKARRIGHGIRLLEDGELLKYMKTQEVPLEICLTSNLQTGVALSLKDHPFREFIDRGLVVTINTDDPSISGITLSGEWELARKIYELKNDEIKKILLNSALAAFTSLQVREKLTERINVYFS